MNTATLCFTALTLGLAGTISAQQVPEQQHMNWGTIFTGGMLNPMQQAESNTYFRVASGSGAPIPNEEFVTLYSDDDAVAWGFDNGGTGDTVVESIYLNIADEDARTAHQVAITIRGEDPMAPNMVDFAVAPLEMFTFDSATFVIPAAPFGRNVEYVLAFPMPVTIPAGTGSIFVGLELGRAAPGAPSMAIIETDGDSLLPAQLLSDGAPAGASQDDGTAATARGAFGHGLGTGGGGYIFIDDITAGMQFFAQSQLVATLMSMQPSFSVAATTDQATLLSSNPGAMPGHTTSFASGHQPSTISRTDDVVFLLRDRDPLLDVTITPSTVHFWTFFMTLAPSGTIAADLSTFFPGSVGAFCVDGGGSAPIEVGTMLNGGNVEGYYSFTFPNASLIGVAGLGLTASVQGLILDLAGGPIPIRASGCSTVYFE